MTVLQFCGPMTFCVLQWCHPMLARTQRRTSCSARMITLYGDRVIKADSGPRNDFRDSIIQWSTQHLTKDSLQDKILLIFWREG